MDDRVLMGATSIVARAGEGGRRGARLRARCVVSRVAGVRRRAARGMLRRTAAAVPVPPVDVRDGRGWHSPRRGALEYERGSVTHEDRTRHPTWRVETTPLWRTPGGR